MIAAINPFLGMTTPVMPIGILLQGNLQMILVETFHGRIVEVPAALPRESLRHICGGTSWLQSQFPIYARGKKGADGHDTAALVVGFDQARAARALIEACCHAETVRRERRSGAGSRP